MSRICNKAFTLIELLIVVAIIAILAAIATVNFIHAKQRALIAADASNLHTLATALQTYYIDYGTLPPADREAGPFASHSAAFSAPGNGPAAGGSWDGVPWLLYENGYVSDWKTLFTPKFLEDYAGGKTIRGNLPRFHNFRYAYNSSALSTGGHAGGAGNVNSGEVWILRNLFLGPRDGFYGSQYPDYPADFRYPYGDGDWEGKVEHAVYSDLRVRMVVGGESYAPEQAGP